MLHLVYDLLTTTLPEKFSSVD